jgi:hypothetical protein
MRGVAAQRFQCTVSNDRWPAQCVLNQVLPIREAATRSVPWQVARNVQEDAVQEEGDEAHAMLQAAASLDR